MIWLELVLLTMEKGEFDDQWSRDAVSSRPPTAYSLKLNKLVESGCSDDFSEKG